MDGLRQYRHYVRIGFVLLMSGGFLLFSLYAKAWTEHNVFPILFPAVVLSAWIAGRLGGLISTISLSAGTAYYHLSPEGPFGIGDPADAIRLGTFTLSGAFVAWLSGALKEKESVLMATLQSIGDAVIATDRHGSVRFLNPLAEALTGWSQKDAKGRPLGEIFRGFHSETDSIVQIPAPEALRAVVSLPENIYLVSKSGNQVPIDDSLAPVQVESGRVLGSILVFRDATRRKESEAALLESERRRLQAQRLEAVGRLAGGVAHDFNNLLTIINGYAELAMKKADYGDRERKGFEEIRNAGEKAAELTRQLLVFSRGQPAKLEIVDLSQILTNFEKMLRRLIGEDIELITIPAREPLPVRVDVGQIEQVIMNLAANARDAMPRGGRLIIQTGVRSAGEIPPNAEAEEACGTYAVLTVTDTGIGIDPRARPHLFEPFFTTKASGRGTGLGLSIIYGIVKSHNGFVRVESAVGRGSTFEVYLPSVPVLQEESGTAESPKEPQQGAATILLVEDNRDVRILMRDILGGLGYDVLEASCAEDAIHMAEHFAGPIDLMVSDIVMPRLGGFELAKHLALLRPGMRVLYVSGYADHETVMQVQRDPTAAYLPKPFGVSDLASKVAEILSRSKEPGAE
jgi:two-component system cell cycle sensor histidine kinase/response regulator CckA